MRLVLGSRIQGKQSYCVRRTEELLAPTTLFNDLNQARLQLLNGRDVVGKNTHLPRFSGYVDLYSMFMKSKSASGGSGSCDTRGLRRTNGDGNVHILGLVDCLLGTISQQTVN